MLQVSLSDAVCWSSTEVVKDDCGFQIFLVLSACEWIELEGAMAYKEIDQLTEVDGSTCGLSLPQLQLFQLPTFTKPSVRS